MANTSNTSVKKRQINYLSRDFDTIKQDLINYLKYFFPDQWQDFNLASPGMALLELNAYVSDLLSYAVDKKYNELFLDGIKSRENAYRMAKTFGFKITGVKPAITISDFSIDVPVTADGPDENYLPRFRPAVKVKGAGQIFETTDEIDFRSDFSEEGIKNRVIEPILNANQDLIKYRIIKREKIKAGVTKEIRFDVDSTEGGPFYSIILPENNVLEITSIAVFPYGTKPNKSLPTYEQYFDSAYRFFEVDSLADNKLFLDPDEQIGKDYSENGLVNGQYIEIPKRFIAEFLSDGKCKITFGGGLPNYNTYDTFLTNLTQNNSTLSVADMLQNTALGEIVQPGSTIYVKYRVGGGLLSNVGTGVLTSVSDINAVFAGSDTNLIQAVIGSASANNPIPAMGGAGLPSVEEIKHNIANNFASQQRCVTLEDYVTRTYQMPGKFGGPFRVFGKVDNNKVQLFILSRDGTGKLISTSTNLIKNNLIEYLSAYRSINDFVEINDGKFINLQIEIDLYTNKLYNASEIKMSVIDAMKDFFNIEKWQMNQNIYISQLSDLISEIPGVINVVELRFYNMEGGTYSSAISSQATGTKYQMTNGEFRTLIEPINNTIFSSQISMFEVRFPEKDIKVRVA